MGSLKLFGARVLFQAPSRVLFNPMDTTLLLATGLIMFSIMLAVVSANLLACIVAGLLGFLRLPTDLELKHKAQPDAKS